MATFSAGILSSQIKLLFRVLQLPLSLAHIGFVSELRPRDMRELEWLLAWLFSGFGPTDCSSGPVTLSSAGSSALRLTRAYEGC
jgi:hypothetical protein